MDKHGSEHDVKLLITMLTIGVLIWFTILLVIAVNVLGWWSVSFVAVGILIVILKRREENEKRDERTAMDVLKEKQALEREEYLNTFHMPTDPVLINHYNELVEKMGEEEARKYWIEWTKGLRNK